MLGLAHEVDRDDLGVRRAVGEDQAVGRACEHVYADAAEQDALRLRHELIAGADEDVGLGQTKEAERHRRDALNAAKREDLVGAAKIGGVDDRGVDALARTGRGTGGDMAASRHLRRRHSHHGGGDMGVAPARRITTSCVDRDRLLTGDQAGADLILEIGDGLFLRLGEPAHVVMSVPNIVLQFLRDLGGGGLNLFPRQNDVAVVFIELRSVGPRGCLSAHLDFLQDRLNRRRHVARIVGGMLGGLLQKFGHGGTFRKSRTRFVSADCKRFHFLFASAYIISYANDYRQYAN